MRWIGFNKAQQHEFKIREVLTEGLKITLNDIFFLPTEHIKLTPDLFDPKHNIKDRRSKLLNKKITRSVRFWAEKRLKNALFLAELWTDL